MRHTVLQNRFVRAMGVFALVLASSRFASGQGAPPRDADTREELRARIRNLMTEARDSIRRGYDALRKYKKSKAAGDREEMRRAWENASVADAQALAYAEQAGPVAEALYWREKAESWRCHQWQFPSSSPAWKAAKDRADQAEKKADAKLAEAQRLAGTDPAIREDLGRYHAAEGAEHRQTETAHREEARHCRERGQTGRAKLWEGLADVEKRDAERAEAAAAKLGQAKALLGRDRMNRLQLALLGRERGGGDNLAVRLKRMIIAELGTLRAKEGQSNEFIGLRREELLGQYARIAGMLKRWEDKLRKKYEDFRERWGI